jgi:hypothetical protein
MYLPEGTNYIYAYGDFVRGNKQYYISTADFQKIYSVFFRRKNDGLLNFI